MNRIDNLFRTKTHNVLSVYFTAGYPEIDSTAILIRQLANAGVDMIEIGIPFSDPVADGPVIQESNRKALSNGMNMRLLFEQLKNIRKDTEIPLLLMGYFNPVQKYGTEDFCKACSKAGIDGVILPDLPPKVFAADYSTIFSKYDIANILLISPQTDEKRIRMIDTVSRGFVYIVSSSSTTGIKKGFNKEQISYFKKIKSIDLKNPALIGFGISDRNAFITACENASGAIIGSSFIKMLGEKGGGQENISRFVDRIRKGSL